MEEFVCFSDSTTRSIAEAILIDGKSCVVVGKCYFLMC